jgi:hypothetical protein
MPLEELSFQEVEELLEGVINNKKLVKVLTKDDVKFIVFSHPSSQEILASRYTRELALLEAAKEELPSKADIEALIAKRNLGVSDPQKISELEKKISAQKRLLDITNIEGRRKPIEETMARYASELATLKSKNEHLFILTQEFRAEEESLLYLAWASTYKITGEKYWATFKDFEADTDLVFRNSLIEEFSNFNRGLEVSKLRFLARHVLWRIRYTAGLKIGGSLFTQGLYDLTPDQQSLLYWSNYYQSISEMLPDDQPDEDTVNNDEALDAYMESYFKQREQERSGAGLKRRSGGKGKLSSDYSDEVIVTANHPDYLKTAYSDERIASEGSAEVEVVSPSSRRARNRRAAKRNRNR